MSNRRKLIAGNWKMNGNAAGAADFASLLLARMATFASKCDLLVCPPFTLLGVFAKSGLTLGAQDCHTAASGAYTGDISAAMLKDAGCRYVIVGHSERRQGHNETNAQIKAKAEAALAAGLIPIICVGESLAERESGNAVAVVCQQLRESVPEAAGFVVAYEPIWAIGTGKIPTLTEIAEMHAALRKSLGSSGAATRILYGGSVKPDNAAAIFGIDDVDGALVGGASLKVGDFLAIASIA